MKELREEGGGAAVDLLTAAMPCNLVELPSETMASVNWFPLSSALGNGVASAVDPNPVLLPLGSSCGRCCGSGCCLPIARRI